jgi:phage protein D
MSASVMARTRGQSVRSTWVVGPVDAFFMSVCLSDRNDLVILAARGMHHKHHHTVPQPQGLHATLAVGVALVFARDGETREHCITADGEDVTARLADYLLSLSVTDASGMESDEIQIDVADPQGRIARPRTGAKLAASMCYASTGLKAMGDYLVDSVEVSSPPRKISIRGHAADPRRGLKNRKAKGWDNTTVGAIVADLDRSKTALSLTLPGRTDMLAETPLELEEFGDDIDGRWIVTRATHRIDSGGYMTDIEGERSGG